MREILVYRRETEKGVSIRVKDSIFNQDVHRVRLRKFILENNLVKVGFETIIYHYDPKEIIDPEQMEYEIFCATVGEIKKPDKEITQSEIPQATVASIIHRGTYDDIDKSYNKLLKWIKDKGFQTHGPAIEIKIRYKEDIRDEKGYITEIQFPVEKEQQ